MKFGIIREGKNPPDKRVPFVPKQCAQLKSNYPGLELAVQSSPVRCFGDETYQAEGISVVDTVNDCDVIFGVKERAYERFEYEVDYLIWFYQRAERMYSINKKKVKKSRHDGGCGLLSSHKQVKEILCRLKELKDNLEFGNTIQRNLLLDCLLKRMQCEYMLDYTIWRFVKNRQRIADIEAQPHHKDIQKRMQERIHLINEQKRMLDSFKTNQIKIYQSDQLIFANTHLVERDHLFAIDGAYEEQKSRPASSKEPAPRKSQMITKQMFEKQSGPGKQKEEAGDHLAVPTEMSGGKLETHEFVKFNYSQYVKKQTAP